MKNISVILRGVMLSRERQGHVALVWLFLVNSYLLSTHIDVLKDIPLLIWIALPFAVLRLSKAIADNAIFDWLRLPYVDVIDDSSGAGKSIRSKEGSIIGGLLECVICVGTWVAEGLLLLWVYYPAFSALLIMSMGAVGVFEILVSVVEALSWSGRNHREDSGTAWMIKNNKPARDPVGEVNGKQPVFHFSHSLFGQAYTDELTRPRTTLQDEGSE